MVSGRGHTKELVSQCVQNTKLKKTREYAKYCQILISQCCAYEDYALENYNAA
jgi:hypothetical protein